MHPVHDLHARRHEGLRDHQHVVRMVAFARSFGAHLCDLRARADRIVCERLITRKCGKPCNGIDNAPTRAGAQRPSMTALFDAPHAASQHFLCMTEVSTTDAKITDHRFAGHPADGPSHGCGMEYHVAWSESAPAFQVIEDAILDADPSASVDLDAAASKLRVAGSLATVELIDLLHHAGYPVSDAQIVALPSYCCGDCAS